MEIDQFFQQFTSANMSVIQNGILSSWRSYAHVQLNFNCYVAT